jgi:hypothetical protein
MTIQGTPAERGAAASVVTIIAGLLLTQAAAYSLDRAVIVAVAFAIVAGLILGTGSGEPISTALRQALIPAAFMPLAYLGFYTLRFLADWSKAGVLPTMGGNLSARQLDLTSSEVMGVAFAALLMWYFATLVLISLVIQGKRTIVVALTRVYSFGPEGVKRTQSIILAIASVSAVLAGIWLALAS